MGRAQIQIILVLAMLTSKFLGNGLQMTQVNCLALLRIFGPTEQKRVWYHPKELVQVEEKGKT